MSRNCKDCKIHNLIKNQCDESVLQEFIDNYCNKCGSDKIKEYSQDEFIDILFNKHRSIINYRIDNIFKVGDIIHLNNPFCDTFKVIDINHDGTENTIDIMPTTQVGIIRFSDHDNIYADSIIRKWVNDVYAKSFYTTIINYMVRMEVKSNNTVLEDLVKILSATEIGLINEEVLDNEGEKYPIFESGKWNDVIKSRHIDPGLYGYIDGYWLRSRVTSNSNLVWNFIADPDSCYHFNRRNHLGVVPVLRF